MYCGEGRPFFGWGEETFYSSLLWHGYSRNSEINFTVFQFFFFFLQLNFKDRVISYKAEGRVHKLKWVYDGTAWDVESGITVKTKHYHSKHGAIEHAVKELIDKLKANAIITN